MTTPTTLPDLATHCRTKAREHHACGRIGRAAELDQIAAALDSIQAQRQRPARTTVECLSCEGRGGLLRGYGPAAYVRACAPCGGTGRVPA